MKNIKTFETFINESINEGKIANPGDIKNGATTLTDRRKMIEDDSKSAGEDVCDMKLLDAEYKLFSKALRTPEDKLMTIDSESNAYHFVDAICIGFQKRRDSNDTSVKLIQELSFNSPWHSANQKRPAYHWHIVDAKIDLISYEDGDDWADFRILVYPKAQEKALITWANANLTEADTEY